MYFLSAIGEINFDFLIDATSFVLKIVELVTKIQIYRSKIHLTWIGLATQGSGTCRGS